MAQEPELDQTGVSVEAKKINAGAAFWTRVQEHKIIQWGIGYLGAALALAHGQELVAHAFHWPDLFGRVFMMLLIAGLPIALTLAWYHGHRGLQRISAGELTIISLLLLIGSVFFTVALQPDENSAEAAALPARSGAGSVRPAVSVEAPPVPRIVEPRDTVLANSVAVLPFENLSPNPDDAYFAAGIHEQVLNQLAKINDLTVIARTSVLRYAGTDVSIPDIARELNVETVMEGSVRYADGNVRITTQLIDAATEAHLWSETYTRPFENIFAIETDIATQIAAALEAELAPDEQRELVKRPTESADAYAHYLRAIAAIAYSFGGLGVPLEESAEFHQHLDRALEVDPEFALGYAAKARDYAYSMGRDLPRRAGLNFEDRATIAIANAERALALDPELGLAYAALSNVHRLSGNYEEARRPLERALALSPNDFQVLFDAVVLHFVLGNAEETMRHAQHAARINPAESFIPLAFAFILAGDYDAAAEQLESRLDYPGIGIELARVEFLRGNNAAVARHLREQERRGIRPPASIPLIAYFYHIVGADDDARRVTGMLEAYAVDYTVGPGDWALAALSTGDNDVALQWLEQAASRRSLGADTGLLFLIAENRLADPVLERPEFVEVRNRLRPR
jgi:TolB-like protein